MIIGHIGVAFATSTRASRISVAGLMVASLLPDIVRAILVFTPWEIEAPLYTHAFPVGLLLPAAAGLIALLISRSVSTGGIVALVVLSHSALDLISGRKPLWADGPELGVGLEQFAAAEFALEALMLWLGWRMLKRSDGSHWAVSMIMLIMLLAAQAAYNFTTDYAAWSCGNFWTPLIGRLSRVVGC